MTSLYTLGHPVAAYPLLAVFGPVFATLRTGVDVALHQWLSVAQSGFFSKRYAGLSSGQGAASLRAVFAMATSVPSEVLTCLREDSAFAIEALRQDVAKYGLAMSEGAFFMSTAGQEALAALQRHTGSAHLKIAAATLRSWMESSETLGTIRFSPALTTFIQGSAAESGHTAAVKALADGASKKLAITSILRGGLAATHTSVLSEIALAISSSKVPSGEDADRWHYQIAHSAAPVVAAALMAKSLTPVAAGALDSMIKGLSVPVASAVELFKGSGAKLGALGARHAIKDYLR